MSVREADDPPLFRRIQEQNLLRQYDLLTNCVEIVLTKGIEAFDKYMLWSLNAAAVSNLAQFGGRFRELPIYVGKHIPPQFSFGMARDVGGGETVERVPRGAVREEAARHEIEELCRNVEEDEIAAKYHAEHEGPGDFRFAMFGRDAKRLAVNLAGDGL